MSSAAPAAPLTPEQQAALAQVIAKLIYWIDFTLTGFSCFFAIMCWDIINKFSVEYQRIWKSPNSPIKFLYIFNRYYSFLAMLATLLMYNIHSTTAQCNKYVKLEPIVPIFVVLSYQSILITRCYAMWQQSKWIIYVFVPLLVGELAYQIYVVTRCEALPYPAAKGPCIVTGPNGVITGYFLVPWAVDLVITVASFYKAYVLWQRSPNSAVLRIFVREGLLAFSVVFLCNVLNGVLYVQPDPFVRPIFAGGSFVICSLMTSRLVLSLRSQETSPAFTQASRSHGTLNNAGTYKLSKRSPDMTTSQPTLNDGFAERDSIDLEGKEAQLGPFNGVLVTKEVQMS